MSHHTFGGSARQKNTDISASFTPPHSAIGREKRLVPGVFDMSANMFNILPEPAPGAATGSDEGAERGRQEEESAAFL